MKLLYTTLITLILLSSRVIAQSVVSLPDVVISEIQLSSTNSASEEFVELANRSVDPIDLTDFKLQYKSKSGSSWTTKATLTGFIAPYGRYLLSTFLSEYSATLNSGLSGAGGHLQLVDTNSISIDLVGWGEAAEPDVLAVATHSDGQSLKRRVNEDGRFIDTDNNFEDWFVSDLPTPEFDAWIVADSLAPPPPDEPVVTPPEAPVVDTPPSVPIEEPLPLVIAPELPPPDQESVRPTYIINITELMPDPTAPLKDSEAEFIELYNPNGFTVDLDGYQLESGSNWRYKYQIPQYFLNPGEFVVIFSQDSKATLTNAGSAVRLIGPDGSELFNIAYPKAKAGFSWSEFSGRWAWATPTPNMLNQEVIIGAQDDNEATDNTQKVLGALTSRDINYPQVEPPSGKNNTATVKAEFIPDVEEPSKVNNVVLAGVGVLAVSYAIYEYRNELRIRLQQLQRYIKLRRKTGQQPKRWGSDRIAQRYRRWQNYFSTWYSQRRG